MAQLGDELAFYAGGTAGWGTRFGFYENWDEAHAYWLTASHLGFAGTLVRGLENGGSLQLELDGQVYYASGTGEQKIFLDERNELVVVLVGDPAAEPEDCPPIATT